MANGRGRQVLQRHLWTGQNTKHVAEATYLFISIKNRQMGTETRQRLSKWSQTRNSAFLPADVEICGTAGTGWHHKTRDCTLKCRLWRRPPTLPFLNDTHNYYYCYQKDNNFLHKSVEDVFLRNFFKQHIILLIRILKVFFLRHIKQLIRNLLRRVPSLSYQQNTSG